MKLSTVKNILLVFTTIAVRAALAGEVDVSADTNFVAKPKARPAAVKTEKAAAAKPVPLVGPVPAQTQWVQTMEASMGPLSTRGTAALTETGANPLLLWMGWAFAVLFGGVLLTQALRNRRRNVEMLRAGDRDAFFFPPHRRR